MSTAKAMPEELLERTDTEREKAMLLVLTEAEEGMEAMVGTATKPELMEAAPTDP